MNCREVHLISGMSCSMPTRAPRPWCRHSPGLPTRVRRRLSKRARRPCSPTWPIARSVASSRLSVLRHAIRAWRQPPVPSAGLVDRILAAEPMPQSFQWKVVAADEPDRSGETCWYRPRAQWQQALSLHSCSRSWRGCRVGRPMAARGTRQSSLFRTRISTRFPIEQRSQLVATAASITPWPRRHQPPGTWPALLPSPRLGSAAMC